MKASRETRKFIVMLITQIKTAVELGVSQSTLQKWVAAGCPHVLINPEAKGRAIRRRFDIEQVRAWLESRSHAADGKEVQE